MTSLVIRNGVATITIDNQAARNALDDVTRGLLLGHLQRAAEDPECVAIVLTGAGRAFCSGGELSSMPTDEDSIRRRLGEMQEIVRIIHAGPKPVACAVDGVAFGSGLSLAAACDYVVGTEKAQFGCSFGRVGLIADTGLMWTLPGRVGARVARAVLLEGRTIGAKEGSRLGLVDELTTTDPVERAQAWAASFVHSAPMAIAATKKLLGGPGGSLDDVLAVEVEMQVGLLASADFREGRAAFFERRAAAFSGA